MDINRHLNRHLNRHQNPPTVDFDHGSVLQQSDFAVLLDVDEPGTQEPLKLQNVSVEKIINKILNILTKIMTIYFYLLEHT